MRCPTLLALLAGVMLYLVIGALVFRTLESPQESKEHEKLLRTTRDFLQNHSCVTAQNLSDLIMSVVKAVEAGLDVKHSSTNFTSRWDLASAFFFCGTIITTIGFGNLSPRTKWGQLFCVCYALVGIPMFGFLLAGVGDHMGTGLRKAVWKMETLFLKRRVSPTYVRVMSAVLSILIGCLIFLAVPTLVFKEVEDWSFLEALYFVVITLTTVGFGDYVAGANRRDGDLFKPLVWLWIVFGLAYFASILTMIGNWLRVLSKKTRAEVSGSEWDTNQVIGRDVRFPVPLHQLPKSPNSTMPLPMPLPMPPLPTPPGCKMLDFFGENLAYIDESSDTLSDRNQTVEGGVSPRTRIHRMRRQLKERRDSDMQPPSNPPTPPPLSHLRD
uniref:Potassium two pore domain channel subfamily K member 4 n=1 Tax=Oncorhynchus kisutch TaxID=8019 RepID=A0A8C7G5X0_ONCKI